MLANRHNAAPWRPAVPTARLARAAAAVLAGSLGLLACGGDDDGAVVTTTTTAVESSTSTSAATVTPSSSATSAPPTTGALGVPVTIGAGEWCGDGSSTGEVDEDVGLYAAWVASIDVEARTLGVDVIRWLEGDEATAAYHAENPDDPEGPPNDYFIVNESTQVRELAVADEVDVRVLGEGATLTDSTFEALPAALAAHAPVESSLLSYNPYWVAINDGEITGICEQYIP